MKRHPEWWPDDPAGPLPPWWFYAANQWRWGALIAVEAAAMVAFWLLDAPRWAWQDIGYVIWAGLGAQWYALWQQHVDRKAKMRALLDDHEYYMGWFDRRTELFDEAQANGYSFEWLRMRGIDAEPPKRTQLHA